MELAIELNREVFLISIVYLDYWIWCWNRPSGESSVKSNSLLDWSNLDYCDLKYPYKHIRRQVTFWLEWRVWKMFVIGIMENWVLLLWKWFFWFIKCQPNQPAVYNGVLVTSSNQNAFKCMLRLLRRPRLKWLELIFTRFFCKVLAWGMIWPRNDDWSNWVKVCVWKCKVMCGQWLKINPPVCPTVMIITWALLTDFKNDPL